MSARLVGLALACAVGVGVGAAAEATTNRPPDTVVVSVRGTSALGYTVERANGGGYSTPTWSETRAECSEYQSRLNRLLCLRVERQHYAHLRVLRDSLRYANRP